MSKRSKEYQKLKKIWYKKLARSGFKDIETDEDHLNVWSSRWARARYIDDAPSRAAYYDLANRFLLEYAFQKELDKIIWEYHANGISYRDISILLKKAMIAKISYTIVYRVVKALKTVMLEKYVR